MVIVGAGTMGRGIAQIYAAKGVQTYLYDAFPGQLDTAKKLINAETANLLAEEIMTNEDIINIHDNIFYSDDLEAIAGDADMAIECVFEDAEAKAEVFRQLDMYCSEDCLFCSNTSGANVFEIADIRNPGRLMITHYFNPAYVMPLVEVVVVDDTSEDALNDVLDLLTAVGKKPSVIRNYIPGFIVNRIATAIVREASYMITQGWTTGEDIDSAIRNTSGIRYAFEGPLALYDIVGWDLTTKVSETIQKSLCNDTGENKLGAEMIEKGALGIKSGKGIYDYSQVDVQTFMNERAHKIIQMMKAIS